MLTYVPTVFDLYRPLRPRLRWAMACLVSFADRGGRCWPSVRKLAEFAGISKSAAARHLTALVETGVVTRRRRPGRGYEYTIDSRFLPRAPVSHSGAAGVPREAAQETNTQKQRKGARPRARFAKPRVSYGEVADDRAKWTARLRGWRQSRFWLPQWGPKPNEQGCIAPIALLHS